MAHYAPPKHRCWRSMLSYRFRILPAHSSSSSLKVRACTMFAVHVCARRFLRSNLLRQKARADHPLIFISFLEFRPVCKDVRSTCVPSSPRSVDFAFTLLWKCDIHAQYSRSFYSCDIISWPAVSLCYPGRTFWCAHM